MCDRPQHARQCGITISRNAVRAGLSVSILRPSGVIGSPDNPEVREQMKAIGAVRRRFGYFRIGVLLQRKGMIMDPKKL